MKVDFQKFEGSLPYASEMYGIYQPLLGWKSKRIIKRFNPSISKFKDRIVDSIATRIQPAVKINFENFDPPGENPEHRIERFQVGRETISRLGSGEFPIEGFVARVVEERLLNANLDDPGSFEIFSPDSMAQILAVVQPNLSQNFMEVGMRLANQDIARNVDFAGMLQNTLEHESVVAGTLVHLYQHRMFDELKRLFSPKQAIDLTSDALAFQRMIDPLESFDPKTDLDRVTLSPVGVVHLFRQYFFEFDTFLGPSVQHVWLSPGGTVELIEVSTRKTLVERIAESTFESLQKTEKSASVQDEIADAIKEENQSNTKFGVGVNTSSTFSIGIFTAQVNTSTNYELNDSTKTAREESHKQLRQQSDKTASEIKRSFKSVFRTVTETQDTTSKRYVLQNTTDKLVNYELRRKMRQVGVQVQDMGTHLCWQTYVDEPGNQLGIAKLVHIAQPADLTLIPDPNAFPQPEALISSPPFDTQRTWNFGAVRKVNFAAIGTPIEVMPPPKPGYWFSHAQVEMKSTDVASQTYSWTYEPLNRQLTEADNIRSITLGVWCADHGIEYDKPVNFSLRVTLYYKPSQAEIDRVNKANAENQQKATVANARAAKDAYYKAVRDRIKVASNIQPRKFEELREEERIIVYRSFIRQLLKEINIDSQEPPVRHILAELIQSMFDVDKMLYFVAPEWWMPHRLEQKPPLSALKPRMSLQGDRFGNPVFQFSPHQNPQDIGLGRNDRAEFDAQHVISWGGAKEYRQDNYYITEDSTPARLGSSLGWLLQLDGDNLRNAFLNAPWVKAVIPIRSGKELAALNWLTHSSVEGTDGLGAFYQATDDQERQRIVEVLRAYPWEEDDALKVRYENLGLADITLHDAIRYLAIRVKLKSRAASEPDPDEPSYLPTDKVYEKGFSHLMGGFQAGSTRPFQVYDQWIEVLPTDQIVAVEVTYDPKTGMQV